MLQLCVGNDFHLSDMLNTWRTDIKYCLTFLSINCLYFAASVTTATGLAHLHPDLREWGTLHLLGSPAMRNGLKGTV